MEQTSGPRRFGLTGTVIGLLALGIAVFHFFLGPIEPPPAMEEIVAETTVKLKNAITAKIQGAEYQAPIEARSTGPDDIVEYLVIGLSFLAIAIGVIGFVQREEWRPSSAAIALGGAAITFQFAIVIAGAILAMMLIAAILGTLNLG